MKKHDNKLTIVMAQGDGTFKVTKCVTEVDSEGDVKIKRKLTKRVTLSKLDLEGLDPTLIEYAQKILDKRSDEENDK